MKLEDLTWPEVREYLKADRHLILPAGTCEQHGMHLPLNTDTLVADKMAELLSGKTGILVGPTLSYGVNLPCDKDYAGTCTTTKESLRDFVSSILEWWKGQGFERFFVISAHGDPIHIEALETSDKDSVRVLELYDFEMTDILEKQQGAKHACEAETSLMLYLYPEKVKKDKIRDFVTPFENFKPYLMHEKEEAIKDSPGVQGYPSYANANKGKKIFTRMLDNALDWISRNMVG
jgi:creatinine amidohydrolase